VLALKREALHKKDISLADMYDTLSFPGFWRMIRKNLRMDSQKCGGRSA